ncbi:WhiB family transcriptional regulator [Streptomyces sp. NPDC014983]|uniref:WhiB family transcriptional regulator n=1 Tax=Streptomyces sp. NPDC014983 TaxID=3364933 RepID=UPI0036F8A564
MNATTLPRQDDTILTYATTDPEVFHDDAHAAFAKRLCADCRLTQSCRTRAREHREWGTWGGETTAERAAAGFAPVGWRGRGHQREHRPCGTPAAYRRHIRHGQKPCTACRAAGSRRRTGSTRRPRSRAKRRKRTAVA